MIPSASLPLGNCSLLSGPISNASGAAPRLQGSVASNNNRPRQRDGFMQTIVKDCFGLFFKPEFLRDPAATSGKAYARATFPDVSARQTGRTFSFIKDCR